MTKKETILEVFDGVLDKIMDGIGYATITSQSGETFWIECPADDFLSQGVREGRPFKAHTAFYEIDEIQWKILPIPDKEVSLEMQKEIDDWLCHALGDDDLPQDDY